MSCDGFFVTLDDIGVCQVKRAFFMEHKEVWDMKKMPCIWSKSWDLVSSKNVIMF